MSDSDLIGGLFFKEPHPNAPDFVKGKLSIKVKDCREWVKTHLKNNPGEEWVNIDLKVSKGGKAYAALDTWKPDGDPGGSRPADEDIPF